MMTRLQHLFQNWGFFIGLGLLLVGMILLSGVSETLKSAQTQKDYFTDRSAYNEGPSGYQAWYTVIQKTNTYIRPWKKPFENLPQPATMVVLEPKSVIRLDVTVRKTDLPRILSWVEKGNTLIWIDQFDRGNPDLLLKTLGLKLVTPKSSTPAHPIAPHALHLSLSAPNALRAFVKQPIVSETQQALAITHSKYPLTVLLENQHHQPVLIRAPYFKGHIIIGTVTDLASNQFLQNREIDNFQYFSNLIRLPKKPVYLNEYVHGHQSDASLFSYYNQHTPLGKVLIQLCFVFLFLLWWSFSPWRPQRHIVLEQDKSIQLNEFVGSLASIYYKADAQELLLTPYLHQIEQALNRRHHLSLSNTPLERVKLQQFLEIHLQGNPRLTPKLFLADIAKAQQLIDNSNRESRPARQSKSGNLASHLNDKSLLDIAQRLAYFYSTLTPNRKSFNPTPTESPVL